MDAGALIGNANWTSEKCVRLLRRSELFSAFPYGALRELLLASRLVSLKKSRRLFAENDAALSGFMLADGVLRYDVGRAADRPTYLTPPVVIGETALVIGCVRPVTVTAETNSVLMESRAPLSCASSLTTRKARRTHAGCSPATCASWWASSTPFSFDLSQSPWTIRPGMTRSKRGGPPARERAERG